MEISEGWTYFPDPDAVARTTWPWMTRGSHGVGHAMIGSICIGRTSCGKGLLTIAANCVVSVCGAPYSGFGAFGPCASGVGAASVCHGCKVQSNHCGAEAARLTMNPVGTGTKGMNPCCVKSMRCGAPDCAREARVEAGAVAVGIRRPPAWLLYIASAWVPYVYCEETNPCCVTGMLTHA